MAHALTLPDEWATTLAVSTPHRDDDPAGLQRLPAEWQRVDGVVLDDVVIDHVVVGPNGVFAIAIDPDPTPVTMRDDGIYRHGARVTTTVKSAVMAGHALRRRLGGDRLAYPMLVTPLDGPSDHLDRLGVIPGGRLAEAIWCHPGFPMTRTQRTEMLWALRGLAR